MPGPPRRKGRPSAPRLHYHQKRDGSMSALATNEAVVPMAAVIVLFVLLLLKPDWSGWIAGVSGSLMGAGIVGFAWMLGSGRTNWKQAWHGSRLLVTRRGDGSGSLTGIGAASWLAAGILVILVVHLVAPDRAWILWIALAGVLVACAGIWLWRRSRFRSEASK